MQNALGITIGPNWNAGGDTVKTAYREPYKDFLEVIGAPALADRAVKTQAPPVSAGSFEKGKEYIIVTENSIYIVSSDISKKRISE